jgi:ribosomal protein S18 acetylase RimI-like enzyme
MPMRKLQLPSDLMPMAEMTMETWQYPENPEWSIQQDEEQSMIDSMQNTKRIWPLIRLTQWLSPALRDILHGQVWEEDGQMVGFTNANRQGGTDIWYISAVGVHPEYRRQGIAQKLVQATISLIEEKGGSKIILDMTEGNTPAFNLYKKLGFEHYSSSGRYIFTAAATPPKPDLSVGYTQEVIEYTDWQSRYGLESRITPKPLLKYEPVDQARYRRPLLARFLRPIVMAASGLDRTDVVIRDPVGQVVAWAWYETRTREGGVNTINILLDPAHPSLAEYLVQELLFKALTESPGHHVEIIVPTWMEGVTAAIRDAGFDYRLGGLRMGLIL